MFLCLTLKNPDIKKDGFLHEHAHTIELITLSCKVCEEGNYFWSRKKPSQKIKFIVISTRIVNESCSGLLRVFWKILKMAVSAWRWRFSFGPVEKERWEELKAEPPHKKLNILNRQTFRDEGDCISKTIEVNESLNNCQGSTASWQMIISTNPISQQACHDWPSLASARHSRLSHSIL